MVINEAQQVLLVLRRDIRIWALPGGGVEPDETWEQAAIRETLEETGYEVAIRRYVGEYWRPELSRGKGELRRVFLGQVVGSERKQPDKESVDVRWFSVTALPRRMFWFSREHVQDALARPDTPVRREQRLPGWMAFLLRVANLFRNKSLRPKSR